MGTKPTTNIKVVTPLLEMDKSEIVIKRIDNMPLVYFTIFSLRLIKNKLLVITDNTYSKHIAKIFIKLKVFIRR